MEKEKSFLFLLLMTVSSAGCTSTSLNTALGTPKNPSAVYADPASKYRDDENSFILANYGVLLDAVEGKSARMKVVGPGYDMRRYLSAGYTLSDMYCARYFRKSDESSRRRRFGRSLTNDAGTAITTILGLANAGQDAVAALAAGTGLADSSWRNYDDSFMISPELSSVQGLVEAAQDNYRSKTLAKRAEMPADFPAAQHMIQRYANLCSHLGMKRLLQESAGREQRSLNVETDKINGISVDPSDKDAGIPASADVESDKLPGKPVTALPTPASNQPK